jgi:predicted ArsR family transcriptional regulator
MKGQANLPEKILEILKKVPMTRDRLAEKLSTPRTTIYDTIRPFILRQEIDFVDTIKDGKRGRPTRYFKAAGLPCPEWLTPQPPKEERVEWDEEEEEEGDD